MHENLIRTAIVTLAVLSASGTAAAMSMPGSGAQFAFGHPGPGGGPVHVIHVRALDSLRFAPAHVRVRRGETVEFVVTNAGKLAHEFVIGDAAVQAEHQQEMRTMPGMRMHEVNVVTLPPGATRDLVWTFTRDGTVEYACHVPGHFAAGMLGTISIEPGRRG